MEVWSGPVTGTGDPSHWQSKISLLDPSLTGQCTLSRDTKLSLHAFVNPALIPYYARTGPALEVHLKDFESAEWWKGRLLSNFRDEYADGGPDDSLPIQCPTGAILVVDEPQRRGAANSSGNIVTDILVYGILSLPALNSQRPQTPPPSSSPIFRSPSTENENGIKSNAPQRELRIYAVTLCSGLITRAEALPSPPLSPEPGSVSDNFNDNDHDNDTELFAEFLPEQGSPCLKRKRMANIFEAATEYHKKVRRKGGEAVAQLMSRNVSSLPAHLLSNSTITNVKKEPLGRFSVERGNKNNNINNDNNNNHHHHHHHHQTHKPRTLSISRITRVPKQSSPATQLLAPTRNSNSNTEAQPRTSSVSSRRSTPASFPPQQQQYHQQDTKISPLTLASASPSEIVAANKAILTRTILTCMRLYGFHRNSRMSNPAAATAQPKRTPLSLSETDIDSSIIPPTTTTAAESQTQTHSRPSTATLTAIPIAPALPDTGEDDDFIAMYHATYRAASFALRRYLKDITTGTTNTGSLAVAEGNVVGGGEGLNKASSEMGGIGVPVLAREKATDLVDGLLRLFCEA